MKRIHLTALGLVLTSSLAFAGIDGAGTTGASFLATGTGPSVLGMGGATLGSGADLGSAAWNPAALAWLRETHVALTHAGLENAQSQEWMAFGTRMGHGANRWGLTALYQGESGFAGRDASNQATDGFDVSNTAFGAHFARAFGSSFAVGLGGKFVSENLAGTTGTGFGVDAGVQGSAGALGFGAAARNVGGTIRYGGASYSLPANLGVGLAWADAAHGLRYALDANFPSNYYNDVRAGVEWRYQDRLALRGGYRLDLGAAPDDRLGGPTFGFGTGANGLWLDYAFLSGSNGAAASHRVGLSLSPGQWMGLRDGLAVKPVNDMPDHEAEPIAQATPKHERTAREVAARPAPVVASPKPEAPIEQPAAPVKAWAVNPVEDTAGERAAARQKTPSSRTIAVGAPTAAVAIARPVEPVEPVRTVVPVKAVEQARAIEPAKVVEQARAIEPAKAVEQAKAIEPAKVVEQAEAIEPAKVIEQAKAIEPAKVIEQAKPAAPVVVAPARRPASVTVRSGQTLADIARQWDTSVPALMMENNLVTERVKSGKSLKLPPPLKH